MGDDARKGSRYSLEDLGIVQSTDPYGAEQLSISLGPNPVIGIAEAQAVFDPATKQWKLASTTRAKFAGNVDAVWKRRDIQPPEPVRTSRSAKWTDYLPKTEQVSVVLSVDWSSTPLGPLEGWPSSLQAYLNIVLADSQAAVIYWGPELCAIYNSELIRLAAGRLNKPEELMGKPFVEIWPELWDDFHPMFKNIAAKGTALETLQVNLFPTIDGHPEETFWSGSFLPIRDNNGVVQGFYNRARETTKETLAERRTKVLSDLSASPGLAGDFVFKHLINAFSSDERDFPMAFVYSASEDPATTRCRLELKCSSGVNEEGHPLVPKEADLYEGHAGFVPFFRRARGLDKPLILQKKDGSLPTTLLEGFDWKGFGEPSRSIAIIPLAMSDRLMGILVIGLNPRRPCDSDYQDFLNILMRQASATVASALDREEAQLRAERLTKQLEDSEKHIRELAEYGPVGIVRIAINGKIMWANDQFYEITGHSRDEEDQYELSFVDVVHPEDQNLSAGLWPVLIDQRRSVSHPLRLKRTWNPPMSPGQETPDEEPVWILASAYPIVEGNEVKAVAAAVTDISRFKWAEAIQSRNAEAAKEAKRLQENFIDIVSHEMRNPLSAITQLSDSISASMGDYNESDKTLNAAKEVLNSNVESAKTILLCAAHQKRIIDDVLTLSKLDSMMLSITPVVVQPVRIVESVLKMFEAEFVANDIQVESKKHESYDKFKIDWVSLDPSRLTQIFINLVTNAIKFTKLKAKRKIMIRIGAASTRPPTIAGVQWFPTNKYFKDLTTGPEWGEGEPIFICFEVQDTGRGLEQSEMTKLFGRFQQATAKTHIKYGGSGLGLFISRELTETQGGEIGVLSERGKGTTFAFYVKSKRAEAPNDPAKLLTSLSASENPKESALTASRQDKQLADNITARRRPCILMVEDNIVNAKVLTTQLEKANCEVHLANHGMEALDFLGRTRSWEGTQNDKEAVEIDAVLMDVEMPIMDGLTCTRRIRQLEEEGKLRKHTNIICITANARQEQIDTVIQAGADDVLPKPFRVRECLSKIESVIAKSLQKQESSSNK